MTFFRACLVVVGVVLHPSCSMDWPCRHAHATRCIVSLVSVPKALDSPGVDAILRRGSYGVSHDVTKASPIFVPSSDGRRPKKYGRTPAF